MDPKLISFAIGIGAGCLAYLAVAWVVTRLLSLHDRVPLQDAEDDEHKAPPDDLSDPSGKGVVL